MMTFRIRLRMAGAVLAGAIVCAADPALSSRAAAPESYAFSLFDGASLDGWTIESPCGVVVRGGLMRLDAGDGWIRTDQEFDDYHLHFEWRALKDRGYDSGVFVRAAGGGDPFPKSAYQINLRQGHEGEIIGVPRTNGGQAAIKPAGQWNTFDVDVVRDRIALRVNGKAAYDVGGLRDRGGYVGFQVEAPKGGPFELRNVRLTEIGRRALFNERDLSGWDAVGGAPTNWTVRDGQLICTGNGHTWLRTRQEYGDFNLRLEYEVADGANSGVYVRVPADGNHHRESDRLPPAGFEVQILDDYSPKHASIKGYQFSASVYDIAGAEPHVSKEHGRWNTLEINCLAQRVSVVHNGVTVVDASSDAYPLLALRNSRGFLGLQSHNGVVRFRNARIGAARVLPARGRRRALAPAAKPAVRDKA